MSQINNEQHGDEGDTPDTGPQPNSSSALQTGTLVLYSLAWSVPRQGYYQNAVEPLQFTLTRRDGQPLQLDKDKDQAHLQVTLPDGTQQSAPDVLVSTLDSVPAVQIACLFAFGMVGAYRFDLSVNHDGQLLKVRKCLLVR